jgi:hypothetical protein
MPETFDPLVRDLHSATGGTGPAPLIKMRDTKTGKVYPRGSKIGKWFGRGLGPRLRAEPQFQALLKRERAKTATKALQGKPPATAPRIDKKIDKKKVKGGAGIEGRKALILSGASPAAELSPKGTLG